MLPTRAKQRLLALGASAALAGFFGACGGSSRTPEAALHSYAQALRDGKLDTAYRLMSAEFRGKHSKAQFKAMVKANAQEVEATSDRLAVEKGTISTTAELDFGTGETLMLRKERGAWKIVTNPLNFYSQATPRDTVRSFVRAYRFKRWDVMLRFVPSKYRENMTVEMVQKQFDGPRKEQIKEMMETVRENHNAPTSESISENTARLRYGEMYEVELEREQGAWKIKRL